MWPESAEEKKPLRSGLTTGTCATACCVAASELLFGGQAPQRVSVTLPKGREVSLDIESCEVVGDSVRAATIKDAGDDPDVTHGATVFVKLSRSPEPGVRFHAGPGVGTVTLGGLGTAYGALVGALLIGLVINLSTLVLDPELKNMIALLAMVLVLMFRPQGLLGKAERIG